MSDDPWALSSGRPTAYEGTVVESWFGVDPNYNQGESVMLFWKLTTDIPGENEIVEERWTVGPDWKSYDGGETIEHPKGDGARINLNTQYGILIGKVKELMGEDIRNLGSPTNAKAWVGTRWFMDETVRKGKLRDGSEFNSAKNFPEKFLGKEDGADSLAGVRDNGQGREGTSPLAGLSEGQIAALKTLAQTKPSFVDFVEAAMEVDGVLAFPDFVAGLADESLYESLRG